MKNRRFAYNGPRVPRHKMKVTTFLAAESMSLLDFILKKMDGISRNKAKGLLSHELVKVDGRVEKQYNFAGEARHGDRGYKESTLHANEELRPLLCYPL